MISLLSLKGQNEAFISVDVLTMDKLNGSASVQKLSRALRRLLLGNNQQLNLYSKT